MTEISNRWLDDPTSTSLFRMSFTSKTPASSSQAHLTRFQRFALFDRFHLWMIAAVWCLWLVLGGRPAVAGLLSKWQIVLTMAFGSFVGGGTSAGGGAVAFPVFTKLLHVTPRDARDFSLAIQSVGMSAASLSILYHRIPIERRALLYAGLPGVASVVMATVWIAPHVPAALVRAIFTVLVSSMGVSLLLANRKGRGKRNTVIPSFGCEEKLILCVAGLVGGMISACIGTGENTVLFIVMVLLFRMNEKVVTSTTVVLMTMVTIPGFLFHLVYLHDLSPIVLIYWNAAVPIAVLMGPLGALCCARMKRKSVVTMLLCLISLEFISTILLLRLTLPLLWLASGGLVVFSAFELLFSRVRIYLPENFEGTLQVIPGASQLHEPER